jgi:hypothetical protein
VFDLILFFSACINKKEQNAASAWQRMRLVTLSSTPPVKPRVTKHHAQSQFMPAVASDDIMGA